MDQPLNAFRLSDVRGIYPTELDFDFAVAFAGAFAHHFSLTGTVAIGRDMRDSSIVLQDGLQQGFRSVGLDVVNLGMCPTELGYFVSATDDVAAVIIVTASHNGPQYNGFKCVLRGGVGVHFDNGLAEIKKLMEGGFRNKTAKKGGVSNRDYEARFIDFLRRRFDLDSNAMGTLALNGLNGTASTLAVDIAYAFEMPVRWTRREPGPIPAGGANPVEPKLQHQMFEFMQSEQFWLGVAWDGDCDRCVFFDQSGQHIPAYYMTGLLAAHCLDQSGPGAVVHDMKAFWNLADIVKNRGGTPVASKTGHSFMKNQMSEHRAVYGGEMSSHHYFGDFFFCDSGMFAWLSVVEMLSMTKIPLQQQLEERRKKFNATAELSLKLENTSAAIIHLVQAYRSSNPEIDWLDGVAMDFGHWRFSLQDSKTEPVARLNIETTDSAASLLEHGHDLLARLENHRRDDDDWQSKLTIC